MLFAWPEEVPSDRARCWFDRSLHQRIFAAAPFERVFTWLADEAVVARIAEERIVACAAGGIFEIEEIVVIRESGGQYFSSAMRGKFSVAEINEYRVVGRKQGEVQLVDALIRESVLENLVYFVADSGREDVAIIAT